MSAVATLPAVITRRVHAEPDDHAPPGARAPGEIAWLALFEDGTIERFPSARALLRAVKRRDRQTAARAERAGRPAMVATVITWNDIPPGFVPPSLESPE